MLTNAGGTDYGFFPEEEISFTSVFLVNETSMIFGVRINDDITVEATEFFTASLSVPSDETVQQLGYDINPNPANLQIGRQGSTTVSIVDNDCKLSYCKTVRLSIWRMELWYSPYSCVHIILVMISLTRSSLCC